MDADDVGVVELAEDLDFAFEAGAALGADEGPAVDDLDGDLAFGGVLDGLVDDALAAAVDLAEDFIAWESVGAGEVAGEHAGP
jgi:hypothetical protein